MRNKTESSQLEHNAVRYLCSRHVSKCFLLIFIFGRQSTSEIQWMNDSPLVKRRRARGARQCVSVPVAAVGRRRVVCAAEEKRGRRETRRQENPERLASVVETLRDREPWGQWQPPPVWTCWCFCLCSPLQSARTGRAERRRSARSPAAPVKSGDAVGLVAQDEPYRSETSVRSTESFSLKLNRIRGCSCIRANKRIY